MKYLILIAIPLILGTVGGLRRVGRDRRTQKSSVQRSLVVLDQAGSATSRFVNRYFPLRVVLYLDSETAYL